MNDNEKRRKHIKDLMYRELREDETFLFKVVIIMKDSIIDSYFVRKAYFDYRGDAEEWHSKICKDKSCYYSWCCDRYYWYNVEELISEF